MAQVDTEKTLSMFDFDDEDKDEFWDIKEAKVIAEPIIPIKQPEPQKFENEETPETLTLDEAAEVPEYFNEAWQDSITTLDDPDDKEEVKLELAEEEPFEGGEDLAALVEDIPPIPNELFDNSEEFKPIEVLSNTEELEPTNNTCELKDTEELSPNMVSWEHAKADINNKELSFEASFNDPFNQENIDLTRHLQLRAKKTLTAGEANELGEIQASLTDAERDRFIEALKKVAFKLKDVPKFDYNKVWAIIEESQSLEVPNNPSYVECRVALGKAQNSYNRVCDIYIHYSTYYDRWQVLIGMLKEAWKSISVKTSDQAREGEFNLHFWDAVAEFGEMHACMKRMQGVMDRCDKTWRTISRQQASLESEGYGGGSDGYFEDAEINAKKEQQKQQPVFSEKDQDFDLSN